MGTRRHGVGGFTLVELLTVVAIAAILMAIALPQFAARQGAAFDARVESEVRLAAVAQEAYYVDALAYSNDCTSLPGFIPSEGVYFPQCTGDAVSFIVEGDHPNSNQSCIFDSTASPSLNCTQK